ncbi:hypothetical protein AAFF_G00054400, partial [Aldrovandia affinis]
TAQSHRARSRRHLQPTRRHRRARQPAVLHDRVGDLRQEHDHRAHRAPAAHPIYPRHRATSPPSRPLGHELSAATWK